MTPSQQTEIRTVQTCIKKLERRKDCKTAVEILKRELVTFMMRVENG